METRTRKMLKISVIVPVYKSEKYIERCIESILNQTYQNIELILVDDGSPDQSAEICDRYAKKDSRVFVLHKENGGVSTARNAGLDMAKGDYIAFVDSDDYLEKDMYEKMVEKIQEYGCDVVMCDCVKEYSESSELYTHDIREGYYNHEQLKKEYYPHLLMMENVEYPATISNGLLLWNSRLNTPNMRYEPGIRYSEDLLFGAKLMYHAKSFFYMKGKTYYHYMINPNSASHTYVPDKWIDYQKLHDSIKKTFERQDSFDFSNQINLCLLFFVYNAVGEIYGIDCEWKKKKERIKGILNVSSVRNMFQQVKIRDLSISTKQKIITFVYKYKICLGLLVLYYEGKNRNGK